MTEAQAYKGALIFAGKTFVVYAAWLQLLDWAAK